MKQVTCKKCGKQNLVWKQSKKGNWYLANVKEWYGYQYGATRTYFPAHRCTVEQQVAYKQEQERKETFRREDFYLFMAQKSQEYFDSCGQELEYNTAY